MKSLRILKKLSARAAPLLPLLGDDRQQFRANGSDDGYIGIRVMDRSCWEHGRSVHAKVYKEMIKRPAANGNGWVYIKPPDIALPGTMMVGATSGYYEPQWDEESTYEALQNQVYEHFTDYDKKTNELIVTRRIKTPSDVFRAAHEMIAARSCHGNDGVLK